MDCSYCTGEAKGLDEDGEPTCGHEGCMEVVGMLPSVIEISGDDDEDEEDE